MARIHKHSLLESLSGAVGKQLVFKQYRDKTVVSRYPDMSGIKPSMRQQMQRDKMKLANAYARLVVRTPVLRALYEESLAPGESIFHKAKKEWFARGED